MDDLAKLDELLAQGYLVHGPIQNLSQLDKKALLGFASFFNPSLHPDILLRGSRDFKWLIMLRHPTTGDRVDILTSERKAIRRAVQQNSAQEKPTGTMMQVCCVAHGGGQYRQGLLHVDELVQRLSGTWGWEFKKGDAVSRFEASKSLQTTDQLGELQALDELQLLLDCLSVSMQFGFRIDGYRVGHIKSQVPVVVLMPKDTLGAVESMLPGPSPQELDIIKSTLSSSAEAMYAARGLNSAYTEHWPPSRLARLWATVEEIFASEPTPLLTKQEVIGIVAKARQIDSLRKDTPRLQKLKEALSNPDRTPLVSRNERMANAIAPIMGITAEVARQKVTMASKLRGIHGHGISQDLGDIGKSEQFLEEVLRRYLGQQKSLDGHSSA